MNDCSASYIKNQVLPVIQRLLSECSVSVADNDPSTIQIEYSLCVEKSYILPYIKLELGPLAAWTPHSKYSIHSYVSEEYPDIFEEKPISVNTLDIERTFWEKATILHHEANQPKDTPIPLRYSRHYYDLYMLASNTEFRNKALSKLDILDNVATFKDRFYPRKWAHYELVKAGFIQLVPPTYRYKSLEKDYKNMQEMIYGQAPTFTEIIDGIRHLESDINALH